MQSAFMHVKEENIQQAYKILKSIKGLNISYISKLLYFSTRALGHSDYFLIFDIRVARSLIRLSCPPTLVNLIDVKPSDKFEHYSQYNVQMHQLAQQHKVSAEALEMYLADFRCLHAYREMRGGGYAAKAKGGLRFPAHPRS